jgi:hypothetical protein
VDFDLLMSRQRQYVSQEKKSLDAYLEHAAAAKAAAWNMSAANAVACNAAVTADV